LPGKSRLRRRVCRDIDFQSPHYAVGFLAGFLKIRAMRGSKVIPESKAFHLEIVVRSVFSA
jgi:hypothetical protein